MLDAALLIPENVKILKELLTRDGSVLSKVVMKSDRTKALKALAKLSKRTGNLVKRNEDSETGDASECEIIDSDVGDLEIQDGTTATSNPSNSIVHPDPWTSTVLGGQRRTCADRRSDALIIMPFLGVAGFLTYLLMFKNPDLGAVGIFGGMFVFLPLVVLLPSALCGIPISLTEQIRQHP
jgi:hypothetical protein